MKNFLILQDTLVKLSVCTDQVTFLRLVPATNFESFYKVVPREL